MIYLLAATCAFLVALGLYLLFVTGEALESDRLGAMGTDLPFREVVPGE